MSFWTEIDLVISTYFDLSWLTRMFPFVVGDGISLLVEMECLGL